MPQINAPRSSNTTPNHIKRPSHSFLILFFHFSLTPASAPGVFSLQAKYINEIRALRLSKGNQQQVTFYTMQQITINNQPLKVGFSFRAIKMFEELADKPVTKCKSTWDNILYFYSTIATLNPEFKQDFETFVDTLNKHPDLLIQFQTMEATNAPKQAVTDTIKKKQSIKTIFGLWTLFLLLSVSPLLLPLISMIAWIGASFWLLARLIAKIGKKPAS